MVETFSRPRFGDPREPKNRVNPGSRLVGVLDFVTGSHVRAIAFLTLCALLVFLPGFFNIPPIDRDEARFAQATKQMVETGDFVDIRFQDEVRYKKPVGVYWLQAAAVETASALGLQRGQGRVWLFRVPSLDGAGVRHAARRHTRRAHPVQFGVARRRSAARENRCNAAAHCRRGHGGAGAGVFVLAAGRGSRASALVMAGDLLDGAGRRHPAQGTVDPDVRGADDRHAGGPRSLGNMAVASASGMGPDVAAGSGAAGVRRDLLARRRCVFLRFDRRRHVEQASRAGIPRRTAGALSAAVLGDVLAGSAPGGDGGPGGLAGEAGARRAVPAG